MGELYWSQLDHHARPFSFVVKGEKTRTGRRPRAASREESMLGKGEKGNGYELTRSVVAILFSLSLSQKHAAAIISHQGGRDGRTDWGGVARLGRFEEGAGYRHCWAAVAPSLLADRTTFVSVCQQPAPVEEGGKGVATGRARC